MHKFRSKALIGAAIVALLLGAPAGAADKSSPSLVDVITFPAVDELVSSHNADHIAWTENFAGIRNIWAADAPDFKARQITNYTADDGQELTQLHFDEAGDRIIYVRGGDHDANWPAERDLAPDPANSPIQPKVEIWAVPLKGGAPKLIVEGDEPEISPTGRIAYLKGSEIWAVGADDAKPARLLFDRGRARMVRWSPDGKKLSFVSTRGDHSFIAVYRDNNTPIVYLAPTTNRDGNPVWSPDSQRIAFIRQPGEGGAREPMLERQPRPYQVWTADVTSGEGQKVWTSPATMDGSYSRGGDGIGLRWMDGDTLTFITTLDGWEHLYALSVKGGQPHLLTPGNFMVEHVAMGKDRRSLLYAANTGKSEGDGDRRHVFRVGLDGKAPEEIAGGTGLQWSPVPAGNGIAMVNADASHPPVVSLVEKSGTHVLHNAAPNYPAGALITPKPVTFTAADGLTVHGQLFQSGSGGAKKPGVIFVHGGPSRQMLLGWHYMDYYSNGYAMNQYMATHGFVVLSVNYRLGIGYGRAYFQPDHAGMSGGSEYQDVYAAARFLASQPGVDGSRIGIWGGSYGGYLTGMALSRNSDLFKAGVDLHGVHDYSLNLTERLRSRPGYEQGDAEQALKVAFESSPDAQIANWRSPVLLIQGDDDRNVRFAQTVDVARRLEQLGVPFEEMVLPNEIHGFLRHESWIKADTATFRFLKEKLDAK